MRYTVALAGSTQRTAQVAKTLLQDERFQILLIVTPQPRPLGRKQVLTQNPLHAFAEKNNVPVVLIDQKLDPAVREQIEQAFSSTPFDFFMVVDFGYLVPKWLLDLPAIAPLNIHPSLLPRWRGASPGQYVLLHGDEQSAVTLMVMNEALDEGPVIAQLPFAVNPSWTQIEYYQYAFDLICEQLGNLIEQFAKGELKAQPQPKESPTILADRLSKEEAFREWTVIQKAMADGTQAVQLERACRAYYPWPKLWTLAPTPQGKKRLIIHRCSIDGHNQLVLEQVQLEGKKITSWLEVKNTLLS
jgi:methionyl-tRNA formyltransferase